MTHLLLLIIYLSFISLGLPDGLLGSAWPSMRLGFQVLCDRITRRLGAGKLTAISTAMTALSLWGFSHCDSYWLMLVWAIPLGLGAGSVDAALNNYVALHYASRHMSWLHCMWGLGATVGPSIMSWSLTGGHGWPQGYQTVALIQGGLTVILFASLKIWRPHPAAEKEGGRASRSLTFGEILAIPGAKAVFITFFGYCALEVTVGLWASSYLVAHSGLPPEEAAGLAGLFYVGITVGRGLSGFVTMKLNDTQMVRLGLGIIAGGLGLMLLPLGQAGAMAGLVLVGLGSAPVYPCLVHSTPERFGAEQSQSIIGMQMAFAYLGNCTMPPLFGFVANYATPTLLPLFLLFILVAMAWMHERVVKVTAA